MFSPAGCPEDPDPGPGFLLPLDNQQAGRKRPYPKLIAHASLTEEKSERPTYQGVPADLQLPPKRGARVRVVRQNADGTLQDDLPVKDVLKLSSPDEPPES